MMKRNITNREDAIEYAKDWQMWLSEVSISYAELAEWGAIFEELAQRYELTKEFKENGII